MVTVSLKNISIDERTTISGDTYFVIRDNENNQVYFCFQNKVKEGWEELVKNWRNIKEVEIEYTENERDFKVYRKVVSLYSPQTEDIFV